MKFFQDEYDVKNRPVGRDFWNTDLANPNVTYRNPNCPVVQWQYKWEFERMLYLVEEYFDEGLDSVLEIGSFMGGSLWEWIQRINYNGKICAISDDAEQAWMEAWSRWCEPKEIYHEWINMSSHHLIAVDLVKEFVNSFGEFDLLFIDGDHSYNGSRNDFLLYGPLVKSGGLIILHDIIWTARHKECEVNLLWEQIKQAGYQTRELYSSPEQSGLGIGIVYVD